MKKTWRDPLVGDLLAIRAQPVEVFFECSCQRAELIHQIQIHSDSKSSSISRISFPSTRQQGLVVTEISSTSYVHRRYKCSLCHAVSPLFSQRGCPSLLSLLRRRVINDIVSQTERTGDQGRVTKSSRNNQ